MKRILVIATGGTIASTPESDGLAPTLTGRELAARVPLLDTLCELDPRVTGIPSTKGTL